MITRLPLRRPDDWHLHLHLHLRDGAMIAGVLPSSARDFARALIPRADNAQPRQTGGARDGRRRLPYRARIRAALPEGARFTPLMTLYLTEETTPADLRVAQASGLVSAVKLYPAGATTNSASEVRNFARVRGALETMAEIGLPLCVHGELDDPEIDIFDREAVFIDRVLEPIRAATPALKVTLEHVTTREGVAYAREATGDIAATITPPT